MRRVIMTDRQPVTEGQKCFVGSFNGINSTINGIQLKPGLCRVSPQWTELHAYIKDYFKDDGFLGLGGVIGCNTFASLVEIEGRIHTTCLICVNHKEQLTC